MYLTSALCNNNTYVHLAQTVYFCQPRPCPCWLSGRQQRGWAVGHFTLQSAAASDHSLQVSDVMIFRSGLAYDSHIPTYSTSASLILLVTE